jgi:hypothetical protein
LSFTGVGLLAPRPTPNLEDQVSEFVPPEDKVAQMCPGHWAAWVPQDRHFPYSLTWAPEGLTKYSILNKGILS